MLNRRLSQCLVAVLLLGAPGCRDDQDEGPAERTGKEIDWAISKAAEKASETVNEVGEQVKAATDYLTEGNPEIRKQAGEVKDAVKAQLGGVVDDIGEATSEAVGAAKKATDDVRSNVTGEGKEEFVPNR